MCGIELRCTWLDRMMMLNTCVDVITWMVIYEYYGTIECFALSIKCEL